MDGDHQQELKLLQQIALHNEHALEQLYDAYATMLFNVIIRIVNIREEAENILQEVFIQIWNRAESYNPKLGSPGVWLIQIARNKSIDYWRSKQARMRSREMNVEELRETDAVHSQPDPLEILSSSQIARLLQDAMNHLPETQKQLIRLAYYEGYSQSELAEKFSLPLGTVKTRMRTAMLALREQLITIPELPH